MNGRAQVPMRVLVTGSEGFVGGHLLELLRREQPAAEVTGLVKPGVPGGPGEGAVRVEADLDDADAIADVVGRARPDRIVHLAAQSSVLASWADPESTLRTNILGLLHILEAVLKWRLSPRILVIGSAEEYGSVEPKDLPIREDASLRPSSPYAVSKVAQSFLALQYAVSHGLAVVRTRTFSHTGPGRGEAFAESSFARQLALTLAGRRPALVEVGNLDTIRDFSDVRDVVRAYWLLIERGEPGEVYNVCSGTGVRIGEILDILIGLAGIDVQVRVVPERARPSDNPALVGDPTRLRSAIGWAPQLELKRTLGDLLDHWIRRVGSPGIAPPA
jgi:GDP-4-dehydro-6-deoxy-D-mannose reductase